MQICKTLRADAAALAVIGLFAQGAKLSLEEYIAKRLEEISNVLDDSNDAKEVEV